MTHSGTMRCDDVRQWRRRMEAAAIALALQVGRIKETSWRWGTVIAGPVDAHFKAWLLALPKPADSDPYEKMTPFFSIFLDNGFGSEHYGTTLTQSTP